MNDRQERFLLETALKEYFPLQIDTDPNLFLNELYAILKKKPAIQIFALPLPYCFASCDDQLYLSEVVSSIDDKRHYLRTVIQEYLVLEY